jgi:hypothetical protein
LPDMLSFADLHVFSALVSLSNLLFDTKAMTGVPLLSA